MRRSTNTAAGAPPPITVRSGIRARSRSAGPPIATATGAGSSRGGGTGSTPSPGVLRHSITAVMEWRKTPGLGVDPVPPPRLDPAPVAVAIGGPADRDRARIPDRTVIGGGAPAAVFVERLIAGHL